MGSNQQSLLWRRPWLIEPTNWWMCWRMPSSRKSRLSEVTLILPHDDVRDAASSANIRSILAAMVDETEFDSVPATQIGVQ
jgi:hypothetical protein